MSGAEKLPAVIEFKENYSKKKQHEYLTYIYYSFGKDTMFSSLLPSNRKMQVIHMFELFDQKKHSEEIYWQEIEAQPSIKEIIDLFKQYSYNTNERHKLIYVEKVEKYEAILNNPNATLEDEMRAEKGVQLYRNKINEIEEKIRVDKEFEEGAVALHLFEIPEEHLSKIIK